jgi:hypothetical protein
VNLIPFRSGLFNYGEGATNATEETLDRASFSSFEGGGFEVIFPYSSRYLPMIVSTPI